MSLQLNNLPDPWIASLMVRINRKPSQFSERKLNTHARKTDWLGWMPFRETGTRLARDRNRLLIAFNERLSRKDVEGLLSKCSLQLEDPGEDELRTDINNLVDQSTPDLRSGSTRWESLSEQIKTRVEKWATERTEPIPDLYRKVAHTPVRFWVRCSRAISQETADQLVRSAERITNPVRWIGPVYRYPNSHGREGLFCPLPNALIVKPSKTADEATLSSKIEELGLCEQRQRSKYLRGERYYILKDRETEARMNVYAIAKELGRESRIVEAIRFENVPLLSSTSGPSVPSFPSDTFFPDQWNLQKIKAPEGWGILQQLEKNGTTLHSVTLCVLDSGGVDLGHPEFGSTVDAYTSQGAETGHPPGQSDDDEHGTMCTGVAVATTDNNQGISGVAGLLRSDKSPLVRLMPVKIVDTLSGIAEGIRYARKQKAQVISISMNPPSDRANDSKEMDDLDMAIDEAIGDGIVICVSSGNYTLADESQKKPIQVSYPATHPGVIACGAINQQDTRCTPNATGFGSNFGNELDVVAPGTKIPSTRFATQGSVPGYTFWFSGTSAATPHVAGLAALILSVNPDLRPTEVRNIIQDSATPLSAQGGWDTETGYGLINMKKALMAVPIP